MGSSRRDMMLYFGLLALLVATVAGAVHITGATVERLLHRDAEATGHGWARYLAHNLADLEDIVAGAPPSDDSVVFFAQTQTVGQVFRYKIFNPDGVLRLVSDDLSTAREGGETIAAHNPTAAAVLRTGQPAIEAKVGAGKPDRPDFYAEAYVPVTKDGRSVGIVEVYVDQAEKREVFQAQVLTAAAGLAGLTFLAFAVPTGGFYWRSRQKRRADEALVYLAEHDPLTGLANRARFMETLEAAMSEGDAEVAVHCIDLDGFKEINEALGPRHGDQVLREVAHRLREVVGSSAAVARLGGDEFAAAQVGPAGPEAATALARRIAEAFRAPLQVDGHAAELSLSIGVAMAPQDGPEAAQLMKCATIALDRARAEGGGRHVVFQPEMDSELQARRDIERRVRAAVADDGFELHFQPLFRARARDRGLSGFEALLRLPAGEGRMISPARFIPVAESMGLIGRIGGWALRRACAAAASWPGELTVAVNLSPEQFREGDIVADVRTALRDSGLAPERLELEITEGMLLADTGNVVEQLAGLRALGVAIAMDDFGTGYSSLGYLWKFRFDRLKIDRSFVSGLDGANSNVTSIIAAIVALGRSLDMEVTAEGVETEAQAVYLQEAGCDTLQGFHLGRPMPETDLPALLLRDARDRAACDAEHPRRRRAGA